MKYTVARGSALVTMGAGTIGYNASALKRVILEDAGYLWSGPIHVASLACGFVLISYADLVFRTLIRTEQENLSSPGELDSIRYILYLRSFREDPKLAIPPQRLHPFAALIKKFLALEQTTEQQIIESLECAGRVVAVGMPNEHLPPIGATRMYLPENNWKPSIQKLISGASLTVIALGSSDGLIWELGEAMRLVPPDRLIILVPVSRREYPSIREHITRELRRHAQSPHQETGIRWAPPELPKSINSDRWWQPAIRGLIYFTHKWEPKYEPLQPSKSYYNSLQAMLTYAIQPVLRRVLGMPKSEWIGPPSQPTMVVAIPILLLAKGVLTFLILPAPVAGFGVAFYILVATYFWKARPGARHVVTATCFGYFIGLQLEFGGYGESIPSPLLNSVDTFFLFMLVNLIWLPITKNYLADVEAYRKSRETA